MCFSSISRRARIDPSPASSNSIPSSSGKPNDAGSRSCVSVSSTGSTLHLAPMAEKLIVDNRRARHEYHLTDRFEAGLVLAGTEVKSLRAGDATLQRAYAEVRDGEAGLVGLHIPEYLEGNRANHDPDRPRKLLLHRREIARLSSSVAGKGSALGSA